MRKSLIFAGVIIIIIILSIGWVSLETFSSPNLPPGAGNCIPSPGFSCGTFKYSSFSGNLSGNLSQDTGVNWTGWAVGYAPSGTNPDNLSHVYFYSEGNLPSGKSVNVHFPSGAEAPVQVGQQTGGWIIVCYTTASGVTEMFGGLGRCTTSNNETATINYTGIATIEVKAS